MSDAGENTDALPALRVAVGRRSFLGAIGAGAAWLVAGTALGGYLDAIPGLSGFRVYNVAGVVPNMDPYTLFVSGPGRSRQGLALEDLQQLPQSSIRSTFHCVTGWSVPGVGWRGVLVRDLLVHVLGNHPSKYVHFHSADGVYFDTLSWDDATRDDVALVWTMNGRPLSAAHGGPVRLLAAPMYGYKSVKWLQHVEVSDVPLNGYWERRGYASDAYVSAPTATALTDITRYAFPDAGLTLAVPVGWTMRSGPHHGLTVAQTHPASVRFVDLAIYDYRFATVLDASRIATFAMSDQTFGGSAQQIRWMPLEGGGRAFLLDHVNGAVRTRSAYIGRGHQVIATVFTAPTHEWSRWSGLADRILQSLRLKPPQWGWHP